MGVVLPFKRDTALIRLTEGEAGWSLSLDPPCLGHPLVSHFDGLLPAMRWAHGLSDDPGRRIVIRRIDECGTA